jgi:PEP-CTERM motif-containing protein
MRLNKLLAVAFVAASVLWGGTAVRAAQIPWQHPSGTTADFNYDNGGTSDQLFVPAGTDPVVTPTGLAFFPSAFKAQASNGSAQNTSDKLSFDIHVKPGKQVTGFTVNEFGDYTIQNTGPNTAVKAFGTLFLTNLDTFEVRFATMTTTPPQLGVGSGVTSGQGAWTGLETIAPIPAGWTNVRVELNNVLQAASDVGTNAFIEKKVVTPGVEINVIIPEPATALMGMLALGLLATRRRAIA